MGLCRLPQVFKFAPDLIGNEPRTFPASQGTHAEPCRGMATLRLQGRRLGINSSGNPFATEGTGIIKILVDFGLRTLLPKGLFLQTPPHHFYFTGRLSTTTGIWGSLCVLPYKQATFYFQALIVTHID